MLLIDVYKRQSLSYQLGGVAGVEVVTPQKGGVDWGTDEGLPAG